MVKKHDAIIILIASFIGGVLYRLGGWGHQGMNTKIRDLGCPAVAVALVYYLNICRNLWPLLLFFLLFFGSLTTYWDKANRFFGKDGEKYWWNWALHGFFIGLSALPIAFNTGHWGTFWLRTLLLTVIITAWSEKFESDIIEEWGKGFFATLTLWLLIR